MSAALRVTEHADRVLVELARPEVRNAIDQATVDELHAVCDSVTADPRVLLIAGSDGVFASGADIGQLLERGHLDALRGINSGLFDRVAKLPMPVIALLDGYVLGAGAELAYACDFRIGTPRVKLGNPEPGLGITAGAGALWRLKELVGEPVAKDLLLTGRIIDADEAAALHLVTEVVEPAELLPAGGRLADRILGHSRLAVRLTKAAFHAPRDAHPLVDNLVQAVLFETDEKHDRMTRFLERRK